MGGEDVTWVWSEDIMWVWSEDIMWVWSEDNHVGLVLLAGLLKLSFPLSLSMYM